MEVDRCFLNGLAADWAVNHGSVVGFGYNWDTFDIGLVRVDHAAR